MSFLTLLAKKNTVVLSFAGKISGSAVENPNYAKRTVASSLLAPTSGSEMPTTEYARISYLDGTTSQTTSSATSGSIAQTQLSFNLIDGIERALGVGTIQGATTAEKVAWMKANLTRLSFDWYGYGSGPGGSKASLSPWLSGSWYTPRTTTSAAVTRVNQGLTRGPSWNDLNAAIQSDGFVNFLAYADAADGTTVSTVDTDYAELTIYLK